MCIYIYCKHGIEVGFISSIFWHGASEKCECSTQNIISQEAKFSEKNKKLGKKRR